MKTEEFDLPAEIARVQRELTFFRQECLPAFLGAPILEYVPKNASDALRDHIITATGTVSSWQRTAARLADHLPLGPLPPEATGPNRDDFREFLIQHETPSFTFYGGRIVWRVNLSVDLETAFRYCSGPGDEAESWGDAGKFCVQLREVKRWLMAIPIDECRLYNALCMVLPAVAGIDPAFAKLALDPATWQALVQADHNLTRGEQSERLNLIHGHFGYILNNALLHVLGALASNHFLLIGEYLNHPHLLGRYTHLMPHYLFAVLFEKVTALRQLATLPERRACDERH